MPSDCRKFFEPNLQKIATRCANQVPSAHSWIFFSLLIVLVSGSIGCQATNPKSLAPPTDLPEELQQIALESFDKPIDSVAEKTAPTKNQLARRRNLSFSRSRLPSKFQITKNQIRIHSNFEIPENNSIISQTKELRNEVYKRTSLAEGDEVIEVYLFESIDKYRQYLSELGNNIPKRRALFLQDEKSLVVLAFWSNKVEIDLRHEITHGYLHSVIPHIPLWVDEGLAEYFEEGISDDGWHKEHLNRLLYAYRTGKWRPDLGKLELLEDPFEMTQLQYSESWLWIHFLLHNKKEHYDIWLHHYLDQLKAKKTNPSLSGFLSEQWPDVNKRIERHLLETANSQKKYGVLKHFMD